MRRLALIVVFGLVVSACGGGDADTTTSAGGTTASTVATTPAGGEAQTVTSDDGALTLVVPAGAGEVTISPLTAEAAGVEDAFEVLGSYDLGPDGSTFDTPIVATFDTGLTVEPGSPLPLLAIALENADGDLEILPASVDMSGETVSITAEVSHFSPVVILGSPDALDIFPHEIVTTPPAIWRAEWDLYDRRYARVMNSPARFKYVVDEFDDAFASVRELIDGINISVKPFVTGVVEAAESGAFGTLSAGSFYHLPSLDTIRLGSIDFARSFGVPLPPLVEIFYGENLFGCEVEGSGTYGFDVGVFLPPGSIAFGVRLSNGGRAIVVPRDGAELSYRVEADALCVDTRYGTMTTLMSLFLGIDRAVINRILEGMIEDGMQDGIWSISGTTPGLFTPWVDLWDAGFYRFNQPQHKVDVTLNYSVFECGETFLFEGYEIETTTVCADEVLPIEEEVVVVPAMYSGPIPVNGDGQEYVYSAVFESNGDPSDDWQFQGQFDWDFFQGADRWYQLFIHGDGSKEISVSQTLGPLLPSGVRALIFEDMILWIIPSSELPADTPLGQVSSFVHDGTFNPATGGGDVLGANPQEPLQPVVDVGG